MTSHTDVIRGPKTRIPASSVGCPPEGLRPILEQTHQNYRAPSGPILARLLFAKYSVPEAKVRFETLHPGVKYKRTQSGRYHVFYA